MVTTRRSSPQALNAAAVAATPLANRAHQPSGSVDRASMRWPRSMVGWRRQRSARSRACKWRERHRLRKTYGFHCKGVTERGVPLPELTQPAAVSLNGLKTAYGLPRPSETISITSLSIGAVSIGRHPNCTENMHHLDDLARRAAV
jgi:hypothetical protein